MNASLLFSANALKVRIESGQSFSLKKLACAVQIELHSYPIHLCPGLHEH